MPGPSLLLFFSSSLLLTASPIDNTNRGLAAAPTIAARAPIDDVPSVDAIRAEIRRQGRVGTDISLFYTALPVVAGTSAPARITAWYECNLQTKLQKGGVAWDGILPDDYLVEQAQRLQSSIVDKFMKRACQAFAANSAGLVFVFYPGDKGDDAVELCKTRGEGLNPPNGYSAWCGQEFPALMRNPKVEAIHQIDLASDRTQGNLIWSKGDGVKLPIQQDQIS
ncbi:hypothetical protein PG991_012472 [Apiospora marii]|uniref:Uncharacterized protein n=1 Tax=Apiospora marii TaxID=335849 RepID=A0ABR1RAT2_9PEZI